MSKGKKLLNEKTVQRFMKLAGTEKLYENVKLEETMWEGSTSAASGSGSHSANENASKIKKLYNEQPVAPDEEELLGALGAAPGGPEAELEPEAGLEPEAELEGEEGLVAPEEVIGDMVGWIAQKAKTEYGVDVDVEREGELEGEEGLEGEEELEGEEGEVAFEPAGEEGAFLGGEEEEEEGMPPGLEEARYRAAQEQHAQEMFMEELSRRVANRVKKEYIVEQVTKRVARRLQKQTKQTKQTKRTKRTKRRR